MANSLREILDKHLNEVKAGHDGKLEAAIEQYVQAAKDEAIGLTNGENGNYSFLSKKQLEYLIHYHQRSIEDIEAQLNKSRGSE